MSALVAPIVAVAILVFIGVLVIIFETTGLYWCPKCHKWVRLGSEAILMTDEDPIYRIIHQSGPSCHTCEFLITGESFTYRGLGGIPLGPSLANMAKSATHARSTNPSETTDGSA